MKKIMSIRFLRTGVWVGSLGGGILLSLLLNYLWPGRGLTFLGATSYLVSGYILDRTVRTYSDWDRRFFTREYGRKMPFLLGLGGPFYLAGEFFRDLWRYP